MARRVGARALALALVALSFTSLAGCLGGNEATDGAAPTSSAFSTEYRAAFDEAQSYFDEGKVEKARTLWLALLASSSSLLSSEEQRELETRIAEAEACIAASATAEPEIYGSLHYTEQARAACEKASRLLDGAGGAETVRPLLEEALKALDRARKSGERDPSHSLVAGFCLLHLGRVEEARSAINEAIEGSPHAPAPVNLKATLYGKAGERDAYVETLQHSLVLDNDQPDIHFSLASALVLRGKAGDEEKAREHAAGFRSRIIAILTVNSPFFLINSLVPSRGSMSQYVSHLFLSS